MPLRDIRSGIFVSWLQGFRYITGGMPV